MIDALLVLVFAAIAIAGSLYFLSLALNAVKTGKVPVKWLVYDEGQEPVLFWSGVLIYFGAAALCAALPLFILWELARAIFVS